VLKKKVKILIYINIFLFNCLEICCSLCYIKNLKNNPHKDYKLIELSDIESLSKENITIESVSNDFNEISQKVIDLNNKIDNEINKINKLYENTINDITKSYIKKHEILIKEENEIKEELKNQVNKIKEKLEIYLYESNNNIKINERINKGIKNIEDKNMIKLISYISKINKNKRNNKKLFSELMKNIKFKYEEDKINYEEYYFNGIPKPINIQFKDITTSSLNISWNIDNVENKEEIKYRIEMRKENEEFKEIYKGNKNNYIINNLIKDTNYEFIIYSFYNNLIESKSEIYKIKTLLDSNILNESGRGNEFIKKLKEWTGYKKMELIYSGTRDGMTSNKFHNKCDDKGETITLIKNEKGNIFGGYTPIPWTSPSFGSYYNASESFIFTLSNIYNTEPTKFPSKNDQEEVYHHSGYGPRFGGGCDLGVYGDILNKGGWSRFPHSYLDILGKGKSIFAGDSNNNNIDFKIKEIEVFKIFK